MASKDVFRFKQFSVRHDRVGMKVGTDGVLLGAWVSVFGAKRLLDIGTGSGVIALMLAQRTAAAVMIDAIEIAQPDAEQAADNSRSSPWAHRVQVYHTSLQQYTSPVPYDVIACNPPFFTNDLKPTKFEREQVRHTSSLPHATLLQCSLKLLNATGRLNVILPLWEAQQFEMLAVTYGLYCSRRTNFRTRRQKPVERILLELSRGQGAIKEEEIILYHDKNAYSPVYRQLTKDFYLGE